MKFIAVYKTQVWLQGVSHETKSWVLAWAAKQNAPKMQHAYTWPQSQLWTSRHCLLLAKKTQVSPLEHLVPEEGMNSRIVKINCYTVRLEALQNKSEIREASKTHNYLRIQTQGQSGKLPPSSRRFLSSCDKLYFRPTKNDPEDLYENTAAIRRWGGASSGEKKRAAPDKSALKRNHELLFQDEGETQKLLSQTKLFKGRHPYDHLSVPDPEKRHAYSGIQNCISMTWPQARSELPVLSGIKTRDVTSADMATS
jgi:hypothetical protein